MDEYDSAQAIYSNLLEYGINSDQIRINLASAFIEEAKVNEALETLKDISRPYANSSISYHNLLTKAYLLKNDLKSSLETLKLAESLISQENRTSGSFQEGIYYSLRGDYYQATGQFDQALSQYQKAIVTLLPGFEAYEIESNPATYSLGMSTLTLFEILVKKAKTAWSVASKSEKNFQLGLQTWRSAFGLAQFISVNFDNDEARVFLGEKALNAYQDGIDLLYFFAQERQEEHLMLEAFAWAEQSKANGLKIGAKQEAIKRSRGLPSDLVQEERNLLFAISKNNQRQFEESNQENKKALETELVDLQVKLSRLREKFKNYPGFDGVQEQLFNPRDFQSRLPPGSAIFSLFLSEKFLYNFWIEKGEFLWGVIPITDIDFQGLGEWMGEVSKPIVGRRYQANTAVSKFSNLLFEPLSSKLKSAKELIIIPQGVFNSFPFELIPAPNGKLIVETVPLSYQFSAQFIQPVELRFNLSKVLGFAPFAGIQESDLAGFSALVTSQNEISRFTPNAYLGQKATKETFFLTASSAEIIHLATHAVASSDDPDQAFISFYPGKEDFRLFAPELAYQSLQNTKLVYLSACETGLGQLSQSEGLISLARSLAFAGAEQMVISLWVSEDQVSAYLANKFYDYAAKEKSFTEALQLAKLDLINDPAMAQFHHPFYWANYRLIGQPSEYQSNSVWYLGLIVVIFLVLGGLWAKSLFFRRD